MQESEPVPAGFLSMFLRPGKENGRVSHQFLIRVTHVKGLRVSISLNLAFKLPLASIGSVMEPADIGSVGYGGK